MSRKFNTIELLNGKISTRAARLITSLLDICPVIICGKFVLNSDVFVRSVFSLVIKYLFENVVNNLRELVLVL
jgi:hypothetical protein